jgi:hypothetical protein
MPTTPLSKKAGRKESAASRPAAMKVASRSTPPGKVRANGRRAALGGAPMGVAEALDLPSNGDSASGAVEADRIAIARWTRLRAFVAAATEITGAWEELSRQLPIWMLPGPKYLGAPPGDERETELSGHPAIADAMAPKRRGKIVNVRPDENDIALEYGRNVRTHGAAEADRILSRDLAALKARRETRAAENKRLGLDVLEDQVERLWDAVATIENAILRSNCRGPHALAAALILALKRYESELFEESNGDCQDNPAMAIAALAAIRPQLTGAIAEDADRTIADADRLVAAFIKTLPPRMLEEA